MRMTALLVCLACLVILSVVVACTSNDQRTGPITPAQADREVRKALGYASSHKMTPPTWGPDFSGAKANRQRFTEMVQDWEAEHFAAIVRYFVTLDPASEQNLRLFLYGAKQCSRLAGRLTVEERGYLKEVYRSSGYIEWIERLYERPDFPSPAGGSAINHFNVAYLREVAIHGIRFGAVACEPLMRRTIDRAVHRERGWCNNQDYWLLGVVLADPDPLSSPDLVRFFGESTRSLVGQPLGLELDLAGRILLAWWMKNGDARIRNEIISCYRALPLRSESTDNGATIAMPPASFSLQESMNGGGINAEWPGEKTCDFIVAAVREPGRLDQAFINLALRFSKQAKERLLACDLRKEWRDALEAAFAEQRRNMPWLQ